MTNESRQTAVRNRRESNQPEQPANFSQANMADRALLRFYLNVTPLLFCLIIIVPAIVWIGTVYLRRTIWPLQFILGPAFALELKKACPPMCTWHNLLIWALLGGFGLLISLLLSNILRKRLLKAIR